MSEGSNSTSGPGTRELARVVRLLAREAAYDLMPIRGHIRIATLRGKIHGWMRQAPRHVLDNLRSTLNGRGDIDDIARRHVEFSKRVHLMRILPMRSGFPRPGQWPVEGLQHLDTALASDRGVIIVTAHLGYPRLVVPILRAHGYDAVQLIAGGEGRLERKQKWEKRLAKAGRMKRKILRRALARLLRPYDLIASLDVRPIFAALEANRAVMVAGDGFHSAEFVRLPLLGKPYPFPMGFMKIAMMTGAPVLPAFVVEQEGPSRIRLVVKPPLSIDHDADIKTNLVQFSRVLEEQLRETPHLWFRWSVDGFFERAGSWTDMEMASRWDQPFAETFG